MLKHHASRASNRSRERALNYDTDYHSAEIEIINIDISIRVRKPSRHVIWINCHNYFWKIIN